MTKRMATRAQRDQRWNRWVIWSCSAAFALVVAIVAFGFGYENLYKANEAIASVYGQAITVQDYAKVLGYKQALMDSQQQQLEQMSQSKGSDPQSSMMAQFAQQQMTALRKERAEVEGKTVEDMMDTRLMQAEAKRRGITVTQNDIDEELVNQFGTRTPPAPQSNEPSSDPNNPDAANAPPTPTPTPPATADEIKKARDQMSTTLKGLKILSEPEYITWVVEPAILRKKLNDAMADSTPRTEEQAHARHILVETKDEADAVAARLSAGEDFGAVAQEVSKDTGSKDQGGDLGWFPRGQMVKEFETIAFSLPPGEVSKPVRSQFGYHVIQVLERGDRELTEEQYQASRGKALQRWLEAQRNDAPNTVAYYMGSAKTMWARDYINKNLNRKVYGG